MSPRATPLAPEERRAAILEAALPLLREHGRATTTKQIAQAAGIAEGTVFRVFATKEELFEAALEEAFDPDGFLAGLEGIDRDLPLHERMVAVVRVLQERFLGIFTLMTALACQAPPRRAQDHDHDEWSRRVRSAIAGVLEPDVDAFRMDLDQVVRVLRLLTFSGSHPHISEQRLLSPEEIVDVVLHGVAKAGS